MNRGNRRIIVASIILTLPLAVLLGSFSNGAPPYKAAHRPANSVRTVSTDTSGNTARHATTQHAVQQPVAHQATRSAVRQVAGVADASRGGLTSGGLTGGILHAFSRGKKQSGTPAAAKQPQHNASRVMPVAGVLDGLVDAIKPSGNKKPVVHNHRNQHPQAAPNWEGIPFHAPNANETALKRAPIRDPSQAPAPQLATQLPQPPALPRSIMVQESRLAPSKTIQALPASSRISGSRSVLPRAPLVDEVRTTVKKSLPVPTRLQTANSSRRDQSVLSSTSSSRRSGRAVLSALDASEIAAASTTPDAIAADTTLGDSLVPKAPRRLIVGAVEAKAKEIKTKAAATKTIVESKVASRVNEELAAIESKVVSQSKAKPVPSAEIGIKPAAAPTTNPSAETNKSVALSPTVDAPAPTLKKPEPMKLEAAPAKVAAIPAPVEKAPQAVAQLSPPTTSPAPEAVASQPALKAQAPSSVTAHRAESHLSGPPASAFDESNVVAESKESRSLNSTPSFAPIGSGVVDPSDNEAKMTVPQRVDAPRIAQAPRATSTRQPYGSSYSPNPYQGKTYTADPYFPPSTQVTRPMHSAQPNSTPQIESSFQARGSVNVPNEMRSTTQPSAQPRMPVGARPMAPGNTGVASELPGIRVVTHGPKQIMIRQSHQFEIRVENRGSIDAEGVMVRAMIPDWAEVQGQNASRGGIVPDSNDGNERLVWTIDQLPAGASEKMMVRLKAERSGTHGLDVDWTLMPQKSVTQIEVREPKLELTIDGPEEVVFGESQTYRVRVLNPGDGVAPNVVFTLSPNSSTPQTQRIGDIPPGKEAQFEVELTAQDLGDLKIAGLASGDLELRAEAAKTIRVSAAKLEAMLTGPELKYQDTDANYNLEIQNKGVATSEKITAVLNLPAGVKYIGGLDKAVQRGSMLSWQVDSLPPSAVRNYQFQCKMAATGDQVFAFDCKGSAAGQAKVSLVTRVEAIADLVMTINDPAAPAPVGADVIYEIVIRNRGSKAATDVRAIAQFSHGIEPRRVEGHSGELLTGQVLFDPIPRIGAGDEVHLKVVANAARPGHHRFRSEIRSGDTVLVSEEATHYMNAKSDRVSRRSSETQTR